MLAGFEEQKNKDLSNKGKYDLTVLNRYFTFSYKLDDYLLGMNRIRFFLNAKEKKLAICPADEGTNGYHLTRVKKNKVFCAISVCNKALADKIFLILGMNNEKYNLRLYGKMEEGYIVYTINEAELLKRKNRRGKNKPILLDDEDLEPVKALEKTETKKTAEKVKQNLPETKIKMITRNEGTRNISGNDEAENKRFADRLAAAYIERYEKALSEED